MKKIEQIFFILLRIFYFAALIALLLSYLAPYANPRNFWLLSFFGLAYPVILLINILFLFWWIIRWKKLYWLSTAVILTGWMNMKHLFHISPVSDALRINSDSVAPMRHTPTSANGDAAKKEIKILSYNVRLFDLYNWTRSKGTRNKIFSFLKDESADILCLQEFFQNDSGYFQSSDTIMKLTKAADFHVEYTITLPKKHHLGIATFSKYPIVNKGAIKFKTRNNNICIWSDMKIGKDTIRVYNLHLQSISFNYADYKFIESLRQKSDTLYRENIEVASKNILRRLKRAFINRASQSEKVINHIDSCKYPVIVCGDFNDSPFSYTYHSFAEKLKDAFMESGTGIGNTYSGIFPSYRIDYIFYSADFASSGFEVVQEKLSDHYPIKCNILRIKKEN